MRLVYGSLVVDHWGTVSGLDSDDFIIGGATDETIYGGGGDDILEGGGEPICSMAAPATT